MLTRPPKSPARCGQTEQVDVYIFGACGCEDAMRLIDRVTQCDIPMQVKLPGGRLFDLPSVIDRADAVRNADVKYILGDDVRDACEQIMRDWPDLLDPSDRSLRLPASTLWVEWAEVGGVGYETSSRVGLFVRVEECGRRGVLQSFWSDGPTGVDVSQGSLRFDFDGQCPVPQPGAVCVQPPFGSSRFPLLMQNSRLEVCAAWIEYFSNADIRGNLAGVYRELFSQFRNDLPFLMSFVRLLLRPSNLTASPVSRSKLNLGRMKRGKLELIDHVELSLRLGHERAGVSAAHHYRRSARQHFVRGHLVRRNGSVHWRSPHLRGDCRLLAAQSRTQRVSLATSRRIEREEFLSLPPLNR